MPTSWLILSLWKRFTEDERASFDERAAEQGFANVIEIYPPFTQRACWRSCQGISARELPACCARSKGSFGMATFTMVRQRSKIVVIDLEVVETYYRFPLGLSRRMSKPASTNRER